MMSQMTKVIVFTMALLLVCSMVEATYRKPPFNGSIFGKRANQPGMLSVSEYEQVSGTTKAFASLCEVVTESCAAWFPNSETNV